jgi:hypothetical protein
MCIPRQPAFPGKVDPARGCGRLARKRVARWSPSSDEIEEGFFMSDPAAATNPEFPENIEFLGFIGGWNCDFGIDTAEELFYLIRTKDADWLEAVVRYSEKIMSQKNVVSVSGQGSKREAAAQLLYAYVRSRTYYGFPAPPYRKGLLTSSELENIVGAVTDEFDRNSRPAEKKRGQHEAPIIKMARELNLNPKPAGHNNSAWIADCPRRSHWIMISPSLNEFGCGYCRRKGGPKELKDFCHSAVRLDGRDKVL